MMHPSKPNPLRRGPGFAGATLLILLVGLVAAGAVPAGTDPEERVVKRGDLVSIFAGDIHVPANTRQRGTVVCVGGSVTIEGEVSQDVVVIMGSLTLSGSVDGTVTAVLSDQVLADAEIDDEYVNVLGSIQMQNTSVSGEFVNILGSVERDAVSTPPKINFGLGWFPSLWTLLFWGRLVRLLAAFVLLLLLVAVVPDRIRLIGDEAPVRYVAAFFVGLLGYLGLLIVLGLLSATVVGIPLFFFAYWVLKWMGIAGIFFAIGRGLGRAFGREMSLLGAVLLTFAIYAVITVAPTPLRAFGLPLSLMVGTLFVLVVQVPAVGLIILTRVGGYASAAPGPLPQPPSDLAAPPPPGPPPSRVHEPGPTAPSTLEPRGPDADEPPARSEKAPPR
jgi:hypothetical protein